MELDEPIAELEEMMANEEYMDWKASCPELYDYVVSQRLTWPSLTVQWLPSNEIPLDADFRIQRLILGTNTINNEQNYLIVAQVKLPLHEGSEKDVIDPSPIAGAAAKTSRIVCEVEVPHQGEVNRARYMPQQPNVIATKVVTGEVHIFDYTKFVKVDAHQQVKPELRLLGHKKEGYGINWNYKRKGYLLSGSEDGLVCLWDIDKATQLNKTMEPVRTLLQHEGIVEDVAWHRTDPNIFGTVGSDKKLMIWDLRSSLPKPVHSIIAHEAGVLSVDFSQYFVATGSEDGTTAVWDLRNLSIKQFSFKQHKDAVNHISWSPLRESVLASGSRDKRILLWDLMKTTTSDYFLPPQLFFEHRGHTSRVCEASWNFHQELFMASVAENNILQVWKVARKYRTY